MAGKRHPKGYLRSHPHRLSIELASLAGMSLAKIEERFGVDGHAVWRHMAKLDPAYRAALVSGVPLEDMARRAAEEGVSILDQLAVVVSGLMHSAIEAKAASDHQAHAALARTAVFAIKEKARISGELRSVPTITNITNNTAILMASPMMQRLQAMLAHRLGPHPEALEAVLGGLAELEASELAGNGPRAPAAELLEASPDAA